MSVRRGGVKSFLERNSFQADKAILEKLVCLRLDPGGDSGFSRPAVPYQSFLAAPADPGALGGLLVCQ